ncbi:MAG: [FeFe] hydrogenase, group A, partial [Symbiobacteriaceae bacterium]|nr:[FeFe] hydrogenase, group A [Symbiobacteriaceae bacterium]
RVREARQVNVELLLSDHELNCPACVRGGNCSLQTLAEKLGIREVPYDEGYDIQSWPGEFPLLRRESKCIRCLRCVSICEKVQSLGVWDTRGSGSRLSLGVTQGLAIEDSVCVLCGQCVTHCPVGALSARDDCETVLEALADPEKTVIVQIAPAVRTAWGEGLGLSREEATVGKMVAAVRRLGVDYVFDTSFAADVTIMEEASELLERFTHRDEYNWPMFTSCCPGWVSFANSQFPELKPNLSSTKSPQQIFGAVAKTWFAKRMGLDPKNVYCVSLMPCMAKKDECTLPGMDSAGTGQDVDAVLTSRELDRLLRSHQVNVYQLEEELFDDPLGASSGAGVIFGSSGGVMEAALRSAYYLTTGSNPAPDAFAGVRVTHGVREITLPLAGTELRAAVVSGLGNARALLDSILEGEVNYDFVEVMACPGGCVGGGGQPIRDGAELAASRSPVLYNLDQGAGIRFSHANPAVQTVYAEFLKSPLSEVAHKLLHRE